MVAAPVRVRPMNKTSVSKIVVASQVRGPARTPASISATMKAKQSVKIGELRQALRDEGFHPLDQQAAVLGLSRSTAWTVLNGNHKASGLSAAVIKRMLASPQLPPKARQILMEYIEQKTAGSFGHSKHQVQRFRARLLDGLADRNL